MAIVTTQTFAQFAEKESVDTDLENLDIEVTGSAVFLFQVRIDNTANTAKSYVRIWDIAAAGVTVGSTVPDFILPCAASSVAEYSFFPGVHFDTAMTVACVTTAGTSGSASPTNSVIVRLLHGATDNDI